MIAATINGVDLALAVFCLVCVFLLVNWRVERMTDPLNEPEGETE